MHCIPILEQGICAKVHEKQTEEGVLVQYLEKTHVGNYGNYKHNSMSRATRLTKVNPSSKWLGLTSNIC